MNKNLVVSSALVLGMAAMAQAQAQPAAPAAAGQIPTKVAIINVQGAIMSTKEGQAAANLLSTKFAPKKAELDKKQADIAALREQLSKGSATMSQEAKDKLVRDIDSNTKSLNRSTEDAQAELDQEQGKIMQDLGGKVLAVIEQYATKNGYAVVLDVSSQQTPVLWAAASVDISSEVVKLYDQAHPAAAAAPAAAAPKPAAAKKP